MEEVLRGDVGYDSTQLKTYMSCPFKYYLKFCLGLRLAKGVIQMLDIEFGQRFHLFVERWYQGLTPSMEDIWGDFHNVESNTDKTKESGQKLCLDYTQRYDRDEYEILDVEYCHETDINGNKFITKLDTIVKLGEDTFSLEHKTTTSITATTFSRLEMDMAMYAQTNAVNEKYGDCCGVILNAAAIKNYKRKYKDIPVGLNSNFERHIVNKGPKECAEFKRTAGHWIDRIQTDTCYPKALGGSACTMYRGCAYAELCSITDGLKVDDYVADAMFETVNPFEYLTEGE